ncbi:MAG: ice-binding family protein [bacterium]|nr:ice-binding family protein [bacterium]
MQKPSLYSIAIVAIVTSLVSVNSNTAHAATAPSLGDAASFSALAGLSMSAAGAGTTISGDLGLSPGLEVSRTGPWTVGGDEYFGVGGLSEDAQTDALGAFNDLAGQSSDGGWGVNPWSPLPGTWTVALDTTFSGTITLDGDYDDVWVFQVGQDMTFDGTVVLAGNAQACNVFWQIGRDATIASGSTFVGTLIASRDVTLVSGATVDGRIISLNSSLTTDGNTISGPTCEAGLYVVKDVVDGTAVAADFNLYVKLSGADVLGSPALGAGTPGTLYSLAAGTYVVSEDADSSYTRSFSGACNSSGSVTLVGGNSYTCTVTNTYDQTTNDDDEDEEDEEDEDVGIKVTKKANPTALVSGPGNVEYTYRVTNEGDVSLEDISVKDDKCDSVDFVSGDEDDDSRLDTDEEWKYTCTKKVSVTEINKVTARGTGNDEEVHDHATARVVVSSPGFPNAGIGPDGNFWSGLFQKASALFYAIGK